MECPRFSKKTKNIAASLKSLNVKFKGKDSHSSWWSRWNTEVFNVCSEAIIRIWFSTCLFCKYFFKCTPGSKYIDCTANSTVKINMHLPTGAF